MPKTFTLDLGQRVKLSSLVIPEKKGRGVLTETSSFIQLYYKHFYSTLLQALLFNSVTSTFIQLFFIHACAVLTFFSFSPVISLPCLRTQCSPKSSARQALPVLQVKPGSLLQMLSKCYGKKVYVLLLSSFFVVVWFLAFVFVVCCCCFLITRLLWPPHLFFVFYS